jgi:hypothetical protein
MKRLIFVLTVFLASLNIYAAEPLKDDPDVQTVVPQQGSWQDGTVILWLCKPGMDGSVRIRIQTIDGKLYSAELACKSATEKPT